MQSFLPQGASCHPVSADPGLAAHSRRVATVALEIARYAPLPRRCLVMLDQAARLHHADPAPMDSSPLSRLMHDLSIVSVGVRAGFASAGRPHALARETVLAAWAFHGIVSRETDPNLRAMAELLTLGNLLDEQMEFCLLEPQTMAQIWQGLRELQGMFTSAVLEAAEKAFPGTCSAPVTGVLRVPLMAATIGDILRSLTWREQDYDSLVAVAGRDPALAGELMHTANSALYGRTNPVRSLAEAVGLIGTRDTRDLLMALALRPLFASSGLLAAWKHSLAVSRFCQGLAGATACMPVEEALLLGLMHDVGRVALYSQNRITLEGYARLTAAGCPPSYVEQLLFGKTHAAIGAELLSSWRFPKDMVEAVVLHHRPADSSSIAAAVVYLGEFWSEADEDLPSLRHLSAAFSRLGCSMEMLAKTVHFQGPFAALLAA